MKADKMSNKLENAMENAMENAAPTAMTNIEEFGQKLQQGAASTPSFSPGMLLKMSKTGVWELGLEGEADTADVWALNPHSLKHGWISWEDAAIQGEVMVPMTEACPLLSTIGDAPGKDGWNQQVSVDAVCVSGDDQGAEATIKGSSLGLREAMREVVSAISQQAQKWQPYVPLFELSSDYYVHKKWGRVYKPVFTMKAWHTMESLTTMQREVEEKEEEAPAQPRTRTARSEKEEPQTPPWEGKEASAKSAPVRSRRVRR